MLTQFPTDACFVVVQYGTDSGRPENLFFFSRVGNPDVLFAVWRYLLVNGPNMKKYWSASSALFSEKQDREFLREPVKHTSRGYISASLNHRQPIPVERRTPKDDLWNRNMYCTVNWTYQLNCLVIRIPCELLVLWKQYLRLCFSICVCQIHCNLWIIFRSVTIFRFLGSNGREQQIILQLQ